MAESGIDLEQKAADTHEVTEAQRAANRVMEQRIASRVLKEFDKKYIENTSHQLRQTPKNVQKAAIEAGRKDRQLFEAPTSEPKLKSGSWLSRLFKK